MVQQHNLDPKEVLELQYEERYGGALHSVCLYNKVYKTYWPLKTDTQKKRLEDWAEKKFKSILAEPGPQITKFIKNDFTTAKKGKRKKR